MNQNAYPTTQPPAPLPSPEIIRELHALRARVEELDVKLDVLGKALDPVSHRPPPSPNNVSDHAGKPVAIGDYPGSPIGQGIRDLTGHVAKLNDHVEHLLNTLAC